jgi:hypothetical protein
VAAPMGVPRLWPNSTVVCVGGGPSLTDGDVMVCRDRQVRVIAINDAHRIAPFADVLYSSDERWWAFYRGVPAFARRKYAVERRPGSERKDYEQVPEEVVVLRNTGDRGIETSPDGLRTAKNSGGAAINLAVHLGAARIVLLGYDMGATRRRPSHWFGEHPPALRATSPYAVFRAEIATMVAPLRELGIEVLNASRVSALECFPRATLEEALS